MTSGCGLLPISPAQGVVVSDRLNMRTRPNPASWSASRSRVIPPAVTFRPIHIHITPGLAESGGDSTSLSNSSADAAGVTTSRHTKTRQIQFMVP